MHLCSGLAFLRGGSCLSKAPTPHCMGIPYSKTRECREGGELSVSGPPGMRYSQRGAFLLPCWGESILSPPWVWGAGQGSRGTCEDLDVCKRGQVTFHFLEES